MASSRGDIPSRRCRPAPELQVPVARQGNPYRSPSQHCSERAFPCGTCQVLSEQSSHGMTGRNWSPVERLISFLCSNLSALQMGKEMRSRSRP